MELQGFQVQICAKAETRCLEMALLVKTTIGHRFCYFSIVSERAKWDLKMDALRKQIQSIVAYILKHGFWAYEMLSKFRQ